MSPFPPCSSRDWDGFAVREAMYLDSVLVHTAATVNAAQLTRWCIKCKTMSITKAPEGHPARWFVGRCLGAACARPDDGASAGATRVTGMTSAKSPSPEARLQKPVSKMSTSTHAVVID